MATTTVRLATGEELEIAGDSEQVAKELANASRSSAGTLAWLEEEPNRQRLGVNPSQVVWIRPGRD